MLQEELEPLVLQVLLVELVQQVCPVPVDLQVLLGPQEQLVRLDPEVVPVPQAAQELLEQVVPLVLLVRLEPQVPLVLLD